MLDNVSDLIYGLERINQIIDLCIDRELYEYVKKILRPGRKGLQYIKELRNTDGKISLEEFDFSIIQFPVLEITTPSDPEKAELFQFPQLFKSEKPPFNLKKKGKDFPLLKNWSDLLWVKLVRAELQKYNKGKWRDRYEDLILFLESRMIAYNPTGATEVDFYTTKFNYLMELSAVAQGEASLGYAERARKLLNKFLFSGYDDPERGSYDRWIWWNMGLAYQHMERSQKAVMDFNLVIKKFPNNFDKFDFALEYLINIVPAYLQRAAINLKLQLGYHALQTLEEGIDHNLEEIKNNYPAKLIADAVEHLRNRIGLHQIEALLQLELLEDVGKRLQGTSIFNIKGWKPDGVLLPSYKKYDPPKAVEIQLVEHIVRWRYQNAERIIINIRDFRDKLQHLKKGKDGGNVCEETHESYRRLVNLIKTFTTYWKWVEGNREDERIFYSRWAQLLKLGMEAVDELKNLKKELSKLDLSILLNPEIDLPQLLKGTIKLYLDQHKPPTVLNTSKQETIELENLRSDDLPDFASGLTSFYKKMCDLLLRSKKNGISWELKCQAEETLKKSSIGNSVDFLKQHHEDLLDALDKYETGFGENQRIKYIKRSNEWEIWSENSSINCDGCCIQKNMNLKEPFYFAGLLACHKEPIERKDKVLYYNDYEYIMQKSEDLFKKHLRSHSMQKPAQKALHFVGLQRWNSLTPAQGRSVGGGYLIYRTDENGQVDLGIAIDPGFDFVRNLFRMGFSLMDIDIVLISHAHADHLWDFETMVQLLHELHGKEKITHRLNVIMTLGIYKRLSHIIKNPKLRSFINPLVVDIRKEIDHNFFLEMDKDNYNFKFKKEKKKKSTMRWQAILPLPGNQGKGEIEIKPTRAYHEDYTDISDSYGFIINIESDSLDGKKALSFGYTGDTKWVDEDLYPSEREDVASQYKKCDVLLFHIGSLIDHKNGNSFKNYGKKEDGKNQADKCIKLIRKENHPYLMGTIRFLKKLGYPCNNSKTGPTKQKKLIFIGEFGEELRGGIRTDLVKRLQGDGLSDWPILPVDVGFDVLLRDYKPPKYKNNKESDDRFKFLCAICDEHRPIEEIDYFRFGQDEAIFHICKTCKKASPDDVRQTKLRKLYEIGRELRTLPD